MRYQEAYELIQVSLDNTLEVPFPVSEKLKAQLFDNFVKDIALRVVRKVNKEEFTAGGDNFAFTNPDYSKQIYKVELIGSNSKSVVPFIPESAMIDNDDANVSHVGYFVKTDIARGTILGDSAFDGETAGVNVLTINTAAVHGLTTGDSIILTELVNGTSNANQPYLDEFVNGKKFSVTVSDTDTFTVSVTSNTTASAALASDTLVVGGVWTEETDKIYFTKDVSGTVKVYYYALPEVKNSTTSRVDLPDQLLTAAIHHTLGDLLNLSGKLQLGSGHKGLAYSAEKEYISTSRSKEPMQDIMSLPLQDFI
tara:strand:- start:271 stop:1200 length:930 start_codon:yes stop_codon:yes gene_type:complete